MLKDQKRCFHCGGTGHRSFTKDTLCRLSPAKTEKELGMKYISLAAMQAAEEGMYEDEVPNQLAITEQGDDVYEADNDDVDESGIPLNY